MIEKDILKKKIGFILLGCDKNRVELENMIANIKNAGFEISENEEEANVIIVNTCAFLQASRDESLQFLQDLQEFRKKNLEKILITGCLTRYANMYKYELSEMVDAIVPLSQTKNIVGEIFKAYGVEKICTYDECARILSTPNHIAYLKIAEGCNNKCAYCAIPNIRGKYVSRTIPSLVDEATRLAEMGVKELILVAQDVTNYGIDIYKKRSLIELLSKLEEIESIKWIRLHYCYPEYISDELIEYIKNSDKVVNYIDVPFQHIENEMLQSMNRKNTKELTYELVNKLKDADIAIRSTFIVGFPGETKQEFKALCKFLKTQRLENVGFFAYSNEVGTRAYDMPNQISERIKAKRLKKIQKLQTKIYRSIQKDKINKCFDMIIDGVIDDYIYLGRTIQNSYGVDSCTYVTCIHEHKVGDILKVRVTKIDGIDLIGEEE